MAEKNIDQICEEISKILNPANIEDNTNKNVELEDQRFDLTGISKQLRRYAEECGKGQHNNEKIEMDLKIYADRIESATNSLILDLENFGTTANKYLMGGNNHNYINHLRMQELDNHFKFMAIHPSED